METKKGYDTLVLSGGGVKGFYLLGGLQAAFDVGLSENLKTYIGTSVGSIISYLLAIGYTPIEIVVAVYSNCFLEKIKFFDLVTMINGNGATSFSSINEALETLTLNKIGKFLTLGKLKEEFGKTLICVTYNTTVCVTEYLGPENYPDLPCLTALRMSSNIPLVFERFKYMDNYYIDGALSDEFPILKGSEIGEHVFGLYLQISEKNLKDVPEDGLVSYFIRLLHIPSLQLNKYKIETIDKNKCTIIPISTEDMQDTIEFNVNSKKRLEMFSAGYTTVKNFLEKKE